VGAAERLAVAVALLSLASFALYTVLYPDINLALTSALVCTVSAVVLAALIVLRVLGRVVEMLEEVLERLEEAEKSE